MNATRSMWMMLVVAVGSVPGHADCPTVSAGAEQGEDGSVRIVANVGQAVIGRATDGNVVMHAGIMPCLSMPEITPGDGPMLVSALSRKTHTGVGSFDINLPVADGSAGVECRADGPTRVFLIFNETIQAVDGTCNLGDEAVVSAGAGTAICTTNRLRLDLNGVPDATCLRIKVSGLEDVEGNPLEGDATVDVVVLKGDVNGDETVDVVDMSKVKGNLFEAVIGSNMRADISLDGAIDVSDMSSVKGHLFNSATCP